MANLVSKIMLKMKLVSSDKVVFVNNSLELLGSYVGQTPAKVDAKVMEAKGGIVFIDEVSNNAGAHILLSVIAVCASFAGCVCSLSLYFVHFDFFCRLTRLSKVEVIATVMVDNLDERLLILS